MKHHVAALSPPGLVLSPGWGLLALGGAEVMHYIAYGLVRSFANAKAVKAGQMQQQSRDTAECCYEKATNARWLWRTRLNPRQPHSKLQRCLRQSLASLSLQVQCVITCLSSVYVKIVGTFALSMTSVRIKRVKSPLTAQSPFRQKIQLWIWRLWVGQQLELVMEMQV